MGERLDAAWHWNPSATLYERDQKGAADVTADGSRVSATNVLIMSVKIEGGIHGDAATTAIVINSIPKVIDAAPGLHTMRDMPLPSYFPGR